MEGTKSPMFEEQAEAIIYYCKNEFDSHEQNVVGLCGMGDAYLYHMIYPTRILSKIIDAINAVGIGGYLMVHDAVVLARCIWFGSLNKDMKKRIAVFAGGPVYHAPPDMEVLGRAMKKANLACDVINFGDRFIGDRFIGKKNLFKTLIDHADNNGNCNICHVPPELSVCEALSSSQIITPRVGGSGSTPSAILSLQHDNAVVVCVKAGPNAPDVLGDCPFCQRVLLTLKVKEVPYNTHFINLDNKPEWFDRVNPDGILPFIKFGGKWYSNSDDIVEMIDEKHPNPSLHTPPRFASVGFKILPKVLKFLKSDGKKYSIEEALLDEQKELEQRLSKHFVRHLFLHILSKQDDRSREITAVDLSLAPKLYHLTVALRHFKEWNVPKKLTHVHKYIKLLLFDWELFQNTKPSEDCLLLFDWELFQNTKPSEDCAIPHAVALVRGADMKSPREAIEFILQLLKVDVCSSIGYCNLTVSCIRTLTQIAFKLSEFISLDRIIDLINPFCSSKPQWQVRIEAFRSLLDLEYHCKGIDAALILFVKYLEEEHSLRGLEGQVKLGGACYAIMSNKRIQQCYASALFVLHSTSPSWKVIILYLSIDIGKMVGSGRPPTLCGVPRDETLIKGDTEICNELKNFFAAIVNQSKPPEESLDCPQMLSIWERSVPKQNTVNASIM
ncbi:dehydroascorbate reductase 2 [Tanacetum coccineum]